MINVDYAVKLQFEKNVNSTRFEQLNETKNKSQ
jgi:hypothetical protein